MKTALRRVQNLIQETLSSLITFYFIELSMARISIGLDTPLKLGFLAQKIFLRIKFRFAGLIPPQAGNGRFSFRKGVSMQ